jgi:hypothetical protein
MEERTCPVCDVWLEVDEVFAFDGFIGINEQEEEWFGHCPRCKKTYHWTEVYTNKETKNSEVCSKEDE